VNTSPTGPRTPDPPAGSFLPLPVAAQATVLAIAAQYPQAVAQSCVATVGAAAWAFLDRAIDALRLLDTRWGYVCKYGNCADLSGDVIAYHASAGPTVQGVTGTWEVDIIANHCPAPGQVSSAQWNVIGYSAAGVWGFRAR